MSRVFVVLLVAFLCGALSCLANENVAPYVWAGDDQQIGPPVITASLYGSIWDDGLPVIPGGTTSLWTQAAGPASVTFANAAAAWTTAQFPTTGVYVLTLSAWDGGEEVVSDDVTITVLGTAPTNRAPLVDAGPDVTVLVGDTISIPGFIVDDALPDTSLRVDWTKESGPGTVKLTGYMMYILSGGIGSPPTGKVYCTSSSTARFLNSGTYVLRLTADDGELSAFDELTVTALPRPIAVESSFGLGTSHAIAVPTEPGSTYRIEYTDQPLSEAAWQPFANTNNGVGTWKETGTSNVVFTFTDDEGANTTGGPTVTGSRYYRVIRP